MIVLPNGNVLSYGAYRFDTADPYVWTPPPMGSDPGSSPNDGTFTLAPLSYNDTEDIFCSGYAFLPNGNLLVTGGHEGDGHGEQFTNLFDFRTNSWSPGPDMGPDTNEAGSGRRWYPTNVTLPSGNVLTASGTIIGDPSRQLVPIETNNVPQVFNWQSGTWLPPLNAAPLDEYYPWLHVAPNGQVFNSGPTPNTQYLNPANGALSGVADTNSGVHRRWGTSVMYRPGEVLIVGGTSNWFYDDGPDDPTNTAEVINLNDSNPSWVPTGGMHHTRQHLNATILPDGQVLVTGGSSSWQHLWAGAAGDPGAQLSAEMWDPGSGNWTEMAAMQEHRMYHSTAVLLRDGRVLAAGGYWGYDENQDPPGEPLGRRSAELYWPPYLFRGARPGIQNVNGVGIDDPSPAQAGYGETITIQTPEAEAITTGGRVTLVGLSAVTHAFNSGQRFLELSGATHEEDIVSVAAPTSNTECPPGFYMLFILDGAGVPSVAKIIGIGTAL